MSKPYYDVRLGAWKHGARNLKAARHGPYTPNPEPPGEGWDSAETNTLGFAQAGLCELWRMDLGEETTFARFADLPPHFNTSGLWWRKA